jgi:hypothetical protein
MDETWGYHYQEVVLQGYISDFVWVGLVRELGGLENGPTTHSWRIPGLGIFMEKSGSVYAATARNEKIAHVTMTVAFFAFRHSFS